jgi:hypothetical protein
VTTIVGCIPSNLQGGFSCIHPPFKASFFCDEWQGQHAGMIRQQNGIHIRDVENVWLRGQYLYWAIHQHSIFTFFQLLYSINEHLKWQEDREEIKSNSLHQEVQHPACLLGSSLVNLRAFCWQREAEVENEGPSWYPAHNRASAKRLWNSRCCRVYLGWRPDCTM